MRKFKTLEVVAASAISVCCLSLALAQSQGLVPWGGQDAAQSPIASIDQAPPLTERPRIEVVFVVDTTGSMGGLLEGAKHKIWAIANRLSSGQPRPELRVGIVAYRDVGDEYVTKRYELTGDMDTVYDHLLGLEADGGGDTPEHLGAGMKSALDQMSWTDDQEVLKLMFVVGDAPAQDGQDGLYARDLARQAHDQGILVNTVQCGMDSVTGAEFRELASAGGGRFSTIDQDGGVVAIATPFDDELAELNRKLAGTMLGYGSAGARDSARLKRDNRMEMSATRAAEAAGWSAKNGRLADEDLIYGLDNGLALDSVPVDQLPEGFAEMNPSEREHHVDRIRQQRKGIESRILELTGERDGYLTDKEAKAGVDKGFDGQVLDIIREQAADKGIHY